MALPTIRKPTVAPNRAMARDVYPVVADQWAASIGPFTEDLIAAITWMGNQVTDVASFRDQAAASAKAAAQSVVDAAAQVKLATDQAAASKASAEAAKASSDSAQVFAAAAGSAAGIGSMVGNAGKAIVVDPTEKSVSYQDVGLRPGDYLYSAANPGSSYVPANAGLTTAQSAYPKIFARIGTLIDWSKSLTSLSVALPRQVAKKGSLWVFARPDQGSGDLMYQRSLDGGSTWQNGQITNIGTGNGYGLTGVEYFNNDFYAIINTGNYSNIWKLADPSAATTTAANYSIGVTPNYPTAMSQLGGKLIVVAPSNGSSISSNGTAWTYSASSALGVFYNVTKFLRNVNGVLYYSGDYIGSGAFGKIARSTDGVNWSLVTVSAEGYGIVAIEQLPNGKLIAIGSASAANTGIFANYGNLVFISSDNGMTWAKQANAPATLFTGITNVPSLGGLIAPASVGTNKVLLITSDGINWNSYPTTAPYSTYQQNGDWSPTVLSPQKIIVGGVVMGFHYDITSQFWIPPVPDISPVVKSYVKVA